MKKIEALLEKFVEDNSVAGKGPLSVMLVVTRHAKERGLPLNEADLLTEEQGQVLGLGRAAVQSILADHKITRVLAEEGGRTSRGSIGHMQRYVAFLNDLNKQGLVDIEFIEKWWVEQIKKHFSGKGFTLHYDMAKSLKFIVEDILEQAVKRQKAGHGTMYAGAVLQHMVGAKLSLVLKDQKITCRGFSVADGPSEGSGDFEIGDVVIHVTTMPSEALLQKCLRNLENGKRPMIITPASGVAGAVSIATGQNLEQRVDIVDAGQFISTNLYELSQFQASSRKVTVENFVERYNEIVSANETDPGLKIGFGK